MQKKLRNIALNALGSISVNQLVVSIKNGLQARVRDLYVWFQKYTFLIIFFLLFQSILYFVQRLPYFNWFVKPVFLLVLFVDWIVISKVLRLSYKHNIIVALVIFTIANLFSFVQLKRLAELLGLVTYGLLLVGIGQMALRMKKHE